MNEAANDQNNEIETNEEELSVEETIEVLSEPENDPIAQLTKERDDMRDKMMRALAEAENTRKRAEKAQQDTSKFAIAGFAKDMLGIADNLRRAIDAIPEDQREENKLLLEGVEATERMMLSSFEKQGIQKIAPTEGKFDPNFHEVMFEAEVPGKQNGEIFQLLEAGYVLNSRLLRPARVGVAKSSGNPDEHKVDTEV
jgi:molecular chaperone GrpE